MTFFIVLCEVGGNIFDLRHGKDVFEPHCFSSLFHMQILPKAGNNVVIEVVDREVSVACIELAQVGDDLPASIAAYKTYNSYYSSYNP